MPILTLDPTQSDLSPPQDSGGYEAEAPKISDPASPTEGKPASDPDEHEQAKKNFDAVMKHLEDQRDQMQRNNDDYNQHLLEIQKLKEDIANPNPPEPHYMSEAPPKELTQDQKMTLPQLGLNILKWGALMGLAYGLTRHSPHRGTMYKLALGAGREADQKQQEYNRDQLVKAWEKNRQWISDNNKLQQERYKAILEDHKMHRQQRMDLLKAEADMWKDKRTADAAVRQDDTAIARIMVDRERLNHDWEKDDLQNRKQWYSLLGLSGKEGSEYRDWILSKGGPDISQSYRDIKKMQEIQSKYPRHEMLEEHIRQKQIEAQAKAVMKSAEEIRKAGGREAARLGHKADKPAKPKKPDSLSPSLDEPGPTPKPPDPLTPGSDDPYTLGDVD